MKTSQRIFRLLDLLQRQSSWTGAALADELQVDVRTVRRDIDRLREVGIVIQSDRGVGGGYQIRATRRVPPLMLSDDEAVAVAIGLRTVTYRGVSNIEEMALSALTKLEQFLPPTVKNRIDDLLSVVEFRNGSNATFGIELNNLMVVSGACRDHRHLNFIYEPREGAATDRAVEPHYVAQRFRRWYLVAWDLDRDDWRTFRMDRVTGLATSKTKFERRSLPNNQTATQYMDAAFAELAPRRVNELTVFASPAEVESVVTWGRFTLKSEGMSETRVTIAETSTDHVLSVIALLAAHYRIRLENVDDEIREALANMGKHLRS